MYVPIKYVQTIKWTISKEESLGRKAADRQSFAHVLGNCKPSIRISLIYLDTRVSSINSIPCDNLI